MGVNSDGEYFILMERALTGKKSLHHSCINNIFMFYSGNFGMGNIQKLSPRQLVAAK